MGPSTVVEALPLGELLVQILIVDVVEKLVELLLIGPVRALYLQVPLGQDKTVREDRTYLHGTHSRTGNFLGDIQITAIYKEAPVELIDKTAGFWYSPMTRAGWTLKDLH